jgi:trans-aconitate methyltransferase
LIDPYGASAEFYDLTSRDAWARKRPILLSAFDQVTGTVVDIGAGTGLMTQALAEKFPEIAIMAVEPSAGMRIALATRVAMAGIGTRVSIVDGTVPGVELPAKLGGAVCCGVLGHLSPADRVTLWESLAERMAPGATVVVELMDETAPPPARLRIAHTRVGELDYEVWSSPARQGWLLSYHVLQNGQSMRELDVPLTWDRIGADRLAEEAAGFGCRRLAPDIYLLRR